MFSLIAIFDSALTPLPSRVSWSCLDGTSPFLLVLCPSSSQSSCTISSCSFDNSKDLFLLPWNRKCRCFRWCLSVEPLEVVRVTSDFSNASFLFLTRFPSFRLFICEILRLLSAGFDFDFVTAASKICCFRSSSESETTSFLACNRCWDCCLPISSNVILRLVVWGSVFSTTTFSDFLEISLMLPFCSTSFDCSLSCRTESWQFPSSFFISSAFTSPFVCIEFLRLSWL